MIDFLSFFYVFLFRAADVKSLTICDNRRSHENDLFSFLDV